jgi:hypothetical protein
MTFYYIKESDHDFVILEETNKIDHLKLHLPNYLSGVHIFFHDIDDNTKKRLQRFVYTYIFFLLRIYRQTFYSHLVSMVTSMKQQILIQQHIF